MSILSYVYKTVFPVKKTNASSGGVGGGGAGARDSSSSIIKNIDATEIIPPKVTPPKPTPPPKTPIPPKNNGGTFGGGGGGSGGFPTQTQTPIQQPSPSAENFNKDVSSTVEFDTKRNRFAGKQSTRTSFTASADEYLNLGAGSNFSGLQTLPKPNIVVTPTVISDVSKWFTNTEVTGARQNVYNQKLTQQYEYQKDTIKRFENDPTSFQGKTGFSSSGMTTKAGEVVTYSLSDDYFKTYTPEYKIKKPDFVSYLADVELGINQVGGDIGYYQKNIYLSAFQNTLTDKGNKKDLGFGIKEFIPKSKYELNLDKTPTYSKTPIAVGVVVASVTSLGVSGVKNIKDLGLVKGSINTVEGLSPIRMNKEFYPEVNYNTNIAKGTLKQINSKTFRGTLKNSATEDIFSIDNKKIVTLKGSFVSATKQKGINVIGVKNSINPKITYDPVSSETFKVTTYKTTEAFYYKFPKSLRNIKPAGAIINNRMYKGQYSEGYGYTISKSDNSNIMSVSQNKAYGINAGKNKRFFANIGELQTTENNIKGTRATYRNFQEDVLKSFLTAKVRVLTPKITPTNKFFSVDNRGTNKPFKPFTSEFKSDKPLEIYNQPKNSKGSTTSIRIKSEQIPKLKDVVVFTPQDYSYSTSDLSKQYQNVISIPSIKQQTTQIQRPINLQRVITTPIQIPRPPKPKTKTDVFTDFGSGSRTTQIPRLDTSQTFTPFYPIPPITPNPNIPKVTPIIPFIPDLNFDSGLSSRKFKGKQSKKYIPSYESFVFKIRGNIPKGVETGYRTRPIPKGFKLFKKYKF